MLWCTVLRPFYCLSRCPSSFAPASVGPRRMPVAVRSFFQLGDYGSICGIYRLFVAAGGLCVLLLPLLLAPHSRTCQAPSTAANSNAPTAQLTSTPTGQGRVYRPRLNLTAIIVSKLSICAPKAAAAVAGQREP